MSTKTNFKRVALVAVAALGLGVLTSVSPASADIDTGDISIVAPAAGTLEAVGVCTVASSSQDTADAVSTGTVVTVGASLEIQVDATTTDGSLNLSGPATFTTSGGGVINSTATKITDLVGNVTIKTSAVGTVTLTAKNDAGVTKHSFGISVVAACSSASTPVAANTLLGINSEQATTDGTDESLTYAEKDYDSTVWVNIVLRNGYKGNVSAGLLTATATNGALIKFDGAGGLASTAFISTAATADEGMGLSVEQDTDTNPGKALSTTITFAFNGVTVGTKSVTILGTPASLTVSKVVGGGPGTDGTFEYVTQDNAGNSVESPAHAGINWTVAGFEAGDILADVAATADYLSTTSFATKGTGKIECKPASTKSSGSVDVAIGFLDAALNLVKSNTFKASCGQGADTFTVALDKAVYSTGEIATLTITAKDKLGAAVGDGTTVGAGIAADLGGLEIIGSAATSTDEFSGGVKTYKFRVLQNVGSFVGQAKITALTDTSVKTLQYKIVASDSGTSMEDVLKAIVSLIASINKQIAALQKALLKKK